MSTNEIVRLRDFAERLAEASRDMVVEACREPVAAELKGDGSPVTAVDKAVELRLREMIASEHPDHGVVGEEHGASMPESGHVWVIDPIDGTLAFIAGLPVFGTLIALARDGVPVVGIVDMPATGERWVGAEGQATTRNGAPVGTRDCATLSSALLSTSSPDFYDASEFPRFERLREASRWTVYGGSCLAYAQIASGRIDVGVDAGLDPFDYCALVPVIRGAGGLATDWDGRALTLRSGGRIVAAGDPRAHAEALELLAGEAASE